MANYFLKSADNAKAYRIDFTQDGATYTINSCSVTGFNITLPSGAVVTAIDTPAKVNDVLVDFALGNVAPSDRASYRSIAAATMDALAAAQKTAYTGAW